MSYYPNQDDINLLFQPTKQIYSKVEILNKDYMVIQNIEGKLISDSGNVDASSNVRRTYNCSLQITSPILDFSDTSVIWFDKYIRPYIGIYDIKRKRIVWYLKGTFSSLNATHTYDEATNTLSLTCNDLMCRLTGDLDGKQVGLNFKIPAGEDIRTSLIGIIEVFGFTRYRIDDLPRRVQHDLEFNAGATAYNMIESLMEFCPNYEFFFDIDGTFVVQRIPCYTNDSDIMTDDIIDRLLVRQDSYTVGFKAKNCVEVWGKSYDEESVDRMAESCTSADGSSYIVRIRNGMNSQNQELTWDVVPDYLIFAVTTPKSITNKAGCSMSIKVVDSTFGPYKIYDDYDRELKAGDLEPDTTYLFCYDVIDEIIPASEMQLVGTWSASKTYAYNDVVVYRESTDDIYKTYIKHAAATAPAGTKPTNTTYWSCITFSTAFILKGVYSSTVEYAATDMVMYKGGLYYCTQSNTKGIAPDTDEVIWIAINLNLNSIKKGNKMKLRGHMTAHATYKNEDGSKFSIKSMGREYWEIFSGGEYDAITSDLLAKERAMYECYYKANLNEVLSLTLVDIPWLDVNKKISYTRRHYNVQERWMINSVSFETLSGTCSVNLSKFYPDWSEVFQSEML